MREALVVLDAVALEHSDDWEGLARARRYLAGVKADITIVDRQLELLLAKAMPKRKTIIEDFGVIERNTAGTWSVTDPVALLRALVALVVMDEDGCIVEQTEPDVAEAAIKLIWELARVDWRVTALKARGLDPNDFMERSEGRVSVSGCSPRSGGHE